MFKRVSLVVAVFILLVTLVSCNQNSFRDKDTPLFTTKSDAIDHYIETESIFGGIQLIQTLSGEELLVTEYRDDMYFLGELIFDDNHYFTATLTATSSFKQGELGGSMSFFTSFGNEYTLDISRTKDTHSVALPDEKYYASIFEGNVIENPMTIKSAIASNETVKLEN